jgi:hypothetical protein
MCYILCTTSYSVYYVASCTHGGDRFWGNAPKNFFLPREMCHIFASFFCCLYFHVHCWEIFWHMVFFNGFIFPVKELELLTNPGHWVRVLDVDDSYMYILF